MSLITERQLLSSSLANLFYSINKKKVATYKIVLNLHKRHNRNFIIDCKACHSKINNPKCMRLFIFIITLIRLSRQHFVI